MPLWVVQQGHPGDGMTPCQARWRGGRLEYRECAVSSDSTQADSGKAEDKHTCTDIQPPPAARKTDGIQLTIGEWCSGCTAPWVHPEWAPGCDVSLTSLTCWRGKPLHQGSSCSYHMWCIHNLWV